MVIHFDAWHNDSTKRQDGEYEWFAPVVAYKNRKSWPRSHLCKKKSPFVLLLHFSCHFLKVV